MNDIDRLKKLIKAEEDYKRFNKALFFTPYEWQLKFINASSDNRQKLAMCANRIGKTFTGASS